MRSDFISNMKAKPAKDSRVPQGTLIGRLCYAIRRDTDDEHVFGQWRGLSYLERRTRSPVTSGGKERRLYFQPVTITGRSGLRVWVRTIYIPVWSFDYSLDGGRRKSIMSGTPCTVDRFRPGKSTGVGFCRGRRHKGRVASVCVIVATAVATVLSMYSPGPSPVSASSADATARSAGSAGQVIHHAGAFQPANAHELRALVNSGMNLALEPPGSIAALERAAPHSSVRYIDSIVQYIYDHIRGLEPMSSPNSCYHVSPGGCMVTSKEIAKIHKAVLPELRRAGHDPRIVAFYTQDDRIGNTRKVLQDIHSWLAKAGIHKPTICGFQGRLDVPSSRQWMSKISSFAADIQGYGTSGANGILSNFSPQGCDMVALYPYSPQANNTQDAEKLSSATDWKMNKSVWPCGLHTCTLLNFYKYTLRRFGWTPATPIIGVPQAFGINVVQPNGQRFVWEAPTSSQLSRETAAFCAGGAQAVLAWAWHVFDTGSSSPYKNKKLRAGLTSGVRACRAIWGRQ